MPERQLSKEYTYENFPNRPIGAIYTGAQNGFH